MRLVEAEEERGRILPRTEMGSWQGGTPLRFLALGDSYTIGEGVPPSERWPVQLVTQFREHGLLVDPPDIIAKTGWTASELLAGLEEKKPQGPYDLVSVLVGVNDQYRGYPLSEYVHALGRMFEQALALAGKEANRVVILSIPDWGVTPFAAGRDRRQIASEIDAFNAVKAAEATHRGFTFVDVTAQSRQAMQEERMLAEDGLHPSGAMYRQWATRILACLVERLQIGDQVAIK